VRRQQPTILAPFAPLETPRLGLVALTFEHAPSIFAFSSDPKVSRLVGRPHHQNMDETRRYIARALVGYARGGHYEWGVVRRADQAFLGICGFGEIDKAKGMGDLYYMLAKAYWGQGYATEAAAAVMQFGFTRLRLRLIEAQAFTDNTASLRVLTKLGLRFRENSQLDEAPGPPRPVSIWRIEHPFPNGEQR
jgi:ribosomal-protein-alanine N-acetyltransferase